MPDATLTLTLIAAALILGGGLYIVFQKQAGGWGARNIQALGLVLLLPTILVLAGLGKIENAVVATLLGAVAGYILGGRFGADKDD